MFRRALIQLCLILSGLSALCWKVCYAPTSDDAKALFSWMEGSRLHISKKEIMSEPVEQKREKVRKDFWIPKGNQRLHARLESQKSSLLLQKKGEKFDAVETLDLMKGSLQESTDSAKGEQDLKVLFAREGFYRYPSHHFEGHSIHFAFYKVKGTDLPSGKILESPLLSGVAQALHFSPHSLKTLSSSPWVLQGGVEVISQLPLQKRSVAKGDELFYFHPSKTLTLTSAPPNRVLFWQEGAFLTAPEVIFHLGETIDAEGRGDVRFFLDTEEENLLEQLLSRYL